MEEASVYAELSAVGYRPTLVGYTGIAESDCVAFAHLQYRVLVLHACYRTGGPGGATVRRLTAFARFDSDRSNAELARRVTDICNVVGRPTPSEP